MTAKERIQRTVGHESGTEQPLYVWFSPEWEARLAAALRVDVLDLHPSLGNDIVPVDMGMNAYMMQSMADGEERISEFGFRFLKQNDSFNIVEYPIRDIDAVPSYRHPDPNAPGKYDILRRQVARYGKEYPILVDISPIVFEAAYSLYGMEPTMLALAMDERAMLPLFERHIEYTLAVAKHCIDVGANIIWTGDDWGTQQSMLISPDMWRTSIKPLVAKLWRGIKRYKPDVIIAHHSCGAIAPIIPDLIELGLDILNPIQPNVPGMAPAGLKRQFGDSLSFLGGIDTQELLRHGSPEEIERIARETCGIFGSGYILSPAHRIHDVPFENIRALFRAAGRTTLDHICVPEAGAA
ncbi:MAG: uroporphyrinogen decarboxylase family protein [Spirochaetota bacterium]